MIMPYSQLTYVEHEIEKNITIKRVKFLDTSNPKIQIKLVENYDYFGLLISYQINDPCINVPENPIEMQLDIHNELCILPNYFLGTNTSLLPNHIIDQYEFRVYSSKRWSCVKK